METGFDAHTHLDFPVWSDPAAVLARGRAAGVRGAFVAAADPQEWGRVRAFSAEHDLPYALGIHPWWCAGVDLEALMGKIEGPSWIGETGLDWVRARRPEDRAWQTQVFRAHLALARETGAPLVLHVVRAYPEALRILRRDGSPGGVVHAWSGPPDLVAGFVDLGFFLSFGMLVRGDRARRARESARICPESALLAETDCPDETMLDRPTEPSDLRSVTAALATLRGVTEAEMLQTTGANARRCFGV